MLSDIYSNSAGAAVLRDMTTNNTTIELDREAEFSDYPAKLNARFDDQGPMQDHILFWGLEPRGKIEGLKVAVNDAFVNHPKTSLARKIDILAKYNKHADSLNAVLTQTYGDDYSVGWKDYKKIANSTETPEDLSGSWVAAAQGYIAAVAADHNAGNKKVTDVESFFALRYGGGSDTESSTLRSEGKTNFEIAKAKMASALFMMDTDSTKGLDIRTEIEDIINKNGLPPFNEAQIANIENIFSDILDIIEEKYRTEPRPHIAPVRP